ncbi:T9SS type A sorting domain-containing protein [Hymenobacter jeollabukensis]|uniref:T9SS type A sorting domain-containing protein n=1 Tax=Hymenobacter jeollabukensis TaxID=2025313 RepID=A0A5R8WQX2_9BACT|nr:T9SS type A sorting domain-containing protein [Hymenobacter jeollabukensis]TLM93129.1 T9SS type A sorting domain-containing protein [Hymenobacter jeollabukensis]
MLLWLFVAAARAQAPAMQVAAGGGYSLSLHTDGTLWTWGNNTLGQSGNGQAGDYQFSPVQTGVGAVWQSVGAGQTHTVAIRQDGTLWAWSANNIGQLGDGTTTNRLAPVQIGTATTWQSLSAGTGYTVAVRTDGTLWAWGNNGSAGKLGYPDIFEQPQQVLPNSTLATAAARLAGARFMVYPTVLAAGQVLHYQLHSRTAAGAELAVYSLAGRLLATQRLAAGAGTVPVGALPAGWYLARVRTADGSTTTSRFLVR